MGKKTTLHHIVDMNVFDDVKKRKQKDGRILSPCIAWGISLLPRFSIFHFVIYFLFYFFYFHRSTFPRLKLDAAVVRAVDSSLVLHSSLLASSFPLPTAPHRTSPHLTSPPLYHLGPLRLERIKLPSLRGNVASVSSHYRHWRKERIRGGSHPLVPPAVATALETQHKSERDVPLVLLCHFVVPWDRGVLPYRIYPNVSHEGDEYFLNSYSRTLAFLHYSNLIRIRNRHVTQARGWLCAV